jgi:hypothetical protein
MYQLQKTQPDGSDWLAGWGAKDLDLDPNTFTLLDQHGQETTVVTNAASVQLDPASDRKTGKCWFRNDKLCPFSREGLLASKVRGEKIPEISEIYTLCGDVASHRRQV